MIGWWNCNLTCHSKHDLELCNLHHRYICFTHYIWPWGPNQCWSQSDRQFTASVLDAFLLFGVTMRKERIDIQVAPLVFKGEWCTALVSILLKEKLREFESVPNRSISRLQITFKVSGHKDAYKMNFPKTMRTNCARYRLKKKWQVKTKIPNSQFAKLTSGTK